MTDLIALLKVLLEVNYVLVVHAAKEVNLLENVIPARNPHRSFSAATSKGN